MVSNNPDQPRGFTRWLTGSRIWCCVGVLLAAHAALLLYGAWIHSVTVDEAAHIPAGLSHWYYGRHDAYRVNPPLPRMLATLPVLCCAPAWFEERLVEPRCAGDRVEWKLAYTFASTNYERYRFLVFAARWAGVVWSVVGGLIVFCWGRELYGSGVALAGVVLWCFEPNILAHAQLATPDLPSSVAALLAAYCLWRYSRRPGRPGAVLVGASLGLAVATKFTLLVFYPAFLVIAILHRVRRSVSAERRPLGTWSLDLAVAGAVSVLTINCSYQFHSVGPRIGEVPFVSRSFGGAAGPDADLPGFLRTGSNRLADTPFAGLRVPLPEDMLRGIDVQKVDFEDMHKRKTSYLAGERRPFGWWYYYLYAIGVKTPLLLLLLAAAGVGLCFYPFRGAVSFRDDLHVLLPALAVLLFVSSQTGFNHHLRYVLPVFPFMILLAAKTAARVATTVGRTAFLLIPLLGLFVVSSLAVYPHSHSYFNEFAGGPKQGWRHLDDSNVDWGQDLILLQHWLAAHPERRPITLHVRSIVDNRIYGLDNYPSADEGSIDSWAYPRYIAISVHHLTAPDTRSPTGHIGPILASRDPDAWVGYSICIYRLDRPPTHDARSGDRPETRAR